MSERTYPASLLGLPRLLGVPRYEALPQHEAMLALHSPEGDVGPDLLELCLDICTPATLAALWHDHTNYIAAHQNSDGNEHWRAMDLIQQDADLIHAHLTHEHLKGDPTAAQKYLDGINHIPF